MVARQHCLSFAQMHMCHACKIYSFVSFRVCAPEFTICHQHVLLANLKNDRLVLPVVYIPPSVRATRLHRPRAISMTSR